MMDRRKINKRITSSQEELGSSILPLWSINFYPVILMDTYCSRHCFACLGTERVSDFPRVTQEAEELKLGSGSLRIELLSAVPASTTLWLRGQVPELRPSVQLAVIIGDMLQG